MQRFTYLILLQCWAYNKVRDTKHMLIGLTWVISSNPINEKNLPNKCLLCAIAPWKCSVTAGWCPRSKRISLSPGKNLTIFIINKQCTQDPKNPCHSIFGTHKFSKANQTIHSFPEHNCSKRLWILVLQDVNTSVEMTAQNLSSTEIRVVFPIVWILVSELVTQGEGERRVLC